MKIRKWIVIGILFLMGTGTGLAFCFADEDILGFIPAILAGSDRPDYWVDAQNGNDGNPGTEGEPFKTITYALSAAGTDKNIQVLPGTYDTTLGETFPLVMQAGQALMGDRENKGSGTTPTQILGYGAVNGDDATIIGADGCRIYGLQIGENSYVVGHYAIWVDGITMQIEDNTFKSPTYAGIWLWNNGTSLVKGNAFNTNSYGIRAISCPDGATIQDNTFSSPGIPIEVSTAASYIVIRDNTITGSAGVGVQIFQGQPLIKDNTFNQAGGYTWGAIRCWSTDADPIIRGNIFSCTTGVRIEDGDPDIGTVLDNGNNNFSSTSVVSVIHEGESEVPAIGNTWPSTPPVCGTDILITSGGTVVYGSSGEQCP